MKTNSKTLTKVKGLGEIETPGNNPLLLHFLSPLELAAHKNHFKKFKYDLDGTVVDIEPHMCRDLYFISKKHTNAMRQILQNARQKLLKQDPQLRKFLLKPLKRHNLPTRIYHVLAGNYCCNMADVAEKGEYGLRRMRGMGKDSLTFLMNLFIENGCGSLFL